MAGGNLNLQGLVTQKALQQQVNQAEAAANPASIDQMTHQAYLQAGIATGTIDPKSLSPADAQALGYAIAQPKTSGGVGGVLGSIGDTLGSAFSTAGKVVSSNVSDFTKSVEGIPEGVMTLGEGAYNSAAEKFNSYVGGLKLPTFGGPDLTGVAKGMAQATVHDFTHFSPYHAVNPALDVSAVLSGGLTGAVRGASAVSRIAQESGAIDEAGNATSSLGKLAASKPVQSLAKVANPMARPPVPFNPSSGTDLAGGLGLPSLPDRYYSTSPARQILLERPIDALFNSKLSDLQIPGLNKGTTLQDLRSNFYARRYGNVGRSQQAATGAIANQSRDLIKAGHTLLKEAGSKVGFEDAHDASIITDALGSWDKTPTEREAAFQQYLAKVYDPQHYEGAVNNTPEAQAIRDFRLKKYSSDSFRKLIIHPTEGMRNYIKELHNVVHNEQVRLGIDPNEIVERSLGPAAYVFGKSTEDLLRERPEAASMNFARTSNDLDKAIRSGDQDAPELQYQALLPGMIPGAASRADKAKLVEDAVESLKADLSGSSRELLNNADNVGYLQGRTLGQKMATGMHDRLGVDNVTAENYMTGGLTAGYYPMYSYALGHHLRYADNLIQRRLNNLRGVRNQKIISAYRRSSPNRGVTTTDLGLSPIANFLKESDLEAFRAGVDIREPEIFSRHIAQVQRELVGRQLTSRMINDIALKDSQGMPVLVSDDAERYNLFNSVVQANKWTTLPANAIRQLFDSEGQAAQQLVPILEGAKGRELTSEEYQQIQNVSDESAQEYVNQVIDEVNSGGKLVVLPRAYVDNLVNHAKRLDRSGRGGLLSRYQGFIHHWRSAVLSYMPAWLFRTSIGHGVVLFIAGVGPLDYARASKFFEDESGTRLGRTFSRGEHEVPVGIDQGSMHEGLGATHGGPVSDVLLGNRFARTNTQLVHNIANFQRRAAFLHSLNKIAKGRMGDLSDAFRFKYPDAFSNEANIADVIENHPDMVRAALNELNRVSYTFGQMSPWERSLAKNILPFWGWFKFISKFTWSLPITFPGRTLALTQIGRLGASQFDKVGPLPDWLRNSILIDTHNLGALRYLPMRGLNPLADVLNPTGGPESIIGLSQTSPIIQAGIEGYGINPLTGGEETIDPASGIVNINGYWYNTNTGQSYGSLAQASVAADLERMVGGLARSFPELNILESLNTGGRSVYPESIPFFGEKIKGKTPSKNTSPLGIIGQLGGVKPATYNELNNLKYLSTDLRRARSMVNKAKALQQVP